MDEYDLEGMVAPQGNTEVLAEMLTGRKTRTDKPVNDIIPTGNLTDEEVKLIRRNQELYSRLEQLKNWLGLKKVPIQERIMEELNFIVESSKSFNGFAGKLLVTKNINQDQNLSQRFEDEEDGNSNIMEKIAEMSQNADTDMGLQAPDPW